ncbi:Tropinone reductase-like protein [Nymphaea thermarum]|nr:Tropinone reductase-like protein [Nymphaea thermarum]
MDSQSYLRSLTFCNNFLVTAKDLMGRGCLEVLKDKEYSEEVLSRTPLRRIGKPQEVSPLLAFLYFPAASYITGLSHCS